MEEMIDCMKIATETDSVAQSVVVQKTGFLAFTTLASRHNFDNQFEPILIQSLATTPA